MYSPTMAATAAPSMLKCLDYRIQESAHIQYSPFSISTKLGCIYKYKNALLWSDCVKPFPPPPTIVSLCLLYLTLMARQMGKNTITVLLPKTLFFHTKIVFCLITLLLRAKSRFQERKHWFCIHSTKKSVFVTNQVFLLCYKIKSILTCFPIRLAIDAPPPWSDPCLYLPGASFSIKTIQAHQAPSF